jgi:hypothetical protein
VKNQLSTKKYDFLRGVVGQAGTQAKRTQRQMLEKASELWLDGADDSAAQLRAEANRASQFGWEACEQMLTRLGETSFTAYRDIYHNSFGGA